MLPPNIIVSAGLGSEHRAAVAVNDFTVSAQHCIEKDMVAVTQTVRGKPLLGDKCKEPGDKVLLIPLCE